jgi:hypothetical protein
MRSNLRLVLTSTATGALLCGLIGVLIGALAGSGTSLLVPGLGLIISGSLALGIVGGLIGAFLGSMLGFLIAAILIILTSRQNYP